MLKDCILEYLYFKSDFMHFIKEIFKANTMTN